MGCELSEKSENFVALLGQSRFGKEVQQMVSISTGWSDFFGENPRLLNFSI